MMIIYPATCRNCDYKIKINYFSEDYDNLVFYEAIVVYGKDKGKEVGVRRCPNCGEDLNSKTVERIENENKME